MHEKSLAYESVILNLTRKENLEADYLAVNPNGVVPTLIDDDRAIIESSVICEYLDDRFPAASLRPPDPLGLASMRLWAKHVDDKIHPASAVLSFGIILRNSFLHLSTVERQAMLSKITDSARRERQEDLLANGINSSRLPKAFEVFRQMADDMEGVVSRTSWMLGRDLTLTDLALAPYVRILEILNLKDAFTQRPALLDWLHRIKQTRGYQNGVASFESAVELERRAAFVIPVADRLNAMFAGVEAP